ncbi:hypothetical protein BHE74_00011848 [Ensete ventricosum]|nr:hypothetical protein BHE74_00011848 [Ensete ventricosum]
MSISSNTLFTFLSVTRRWSKSIVTGRFRVVTDGNNHYLAVSPGSGQSAYRSAGGLVCIARYGTLPPGCVAGIMATGAINVVRGTRSSNEELFHIYDHSERLKLLYSLLS